MKANAAAFALDGELTAVEKLHFSAGELPLPQQIVAKRQDGDPSKLEVSWTNDENLSPLYDHDELMMIAGYPDHFTTLIATTVHRKAAQAVIDLPEVYEEIMGIWLFFAAHNRQAYSPDQFFAI